MALLTDGATAEVIFASPVSAAWQALTPIPGTGFNGALADAVTNGTALPIYVINAASGMFAYPGGLAVGYDDTIITVSGSGSTETVTPSGGGPVVWIKIAGLVYIYGPAGVLETVSTIEASALKAFLP